MRNAIVLAAGKGTRMKSDRSKVMHTIIDRSMLAYIIDALRAVSVERIVVIVGYQAESIKEAFPDVEFALQQPQLGTGHAVMQATQLKDEDGDTLIAAMQYALMIHYSYISSANEAVSKIVYGFLSASDGTYIGFAGTDEDTTNMAYLAMYSLFYSGQPILYSTDISLDDGLDVISEDTSSRQADTSAQASNNSSSTAMCWLSATGSKYHSINNCGRMNPNNARQVTIAEAERQGYGRCKKCW